MKIYMIFFPESQRNLSDHCHLGEIIWFRGGLWLFWVWICSWTLGSNVILYTNSYFKQPQTKIHWGAQTQNWSTFVHASDSIKDLISHVFLTWISVVYIWNFGQRHFVVFTGDLVVQLSVSLFGSCIIKPLHFWNNIFFQKLCPNPAVSR